MEIILSSHPILPRQKPRRLYLDAERLRYDQERQHKIDTL